MTKTTTLNIDPERLKDCLTAANYYLGQQMAADITTGARKEIVMVRGTFDEFIDAIDAMIERGEV